VSWKQGEDVGKAKELILDLLDWVLISMHGDALIKTKRFTCSHKRGSKRK
jgi:hypothetical protein